MGSEVIHNAVAVPAIDHVCVKTACPFGFEGSDPSYSFPTVFVQIGIILDGEGHGLALLWKHNPPPAADVQEWHGVERTVPNLIHDPGSDACHIIRAVKPKSFLNAGMEELKFIFKHLFVDGSHRSISGEVRRQ